MAGIPLKQPPHRELTGGDLLSQSLASLGVTVAFGLHGGHLDAFLMGCEFIGIKLVDTRHETVAVQAAEGYSKVSGKTGICFVTANSGYSNGLPGLATAFADRSSILCITSSVPLRDQENNSLQGQIDQVVVAQPITKFAHRVTNAEDIPRIISHALHVSQAGAPGPVLLDFPIDVLFSPVTQSQISWGSIASPPVYLPGPHSEAVTAALALLKDAQRPALIISSGARTKELFKHLREFMRLTKIPVFTNSRFARLDELAKESTYAGSVGSLAALAMSGQPQPDCVILLGARVGMYLGGRSGAIIPNQGCKVIQIDTDGAEIGRTIPVDVGIVSDASQALKAFNSEIFSNPSQASQSWLDTLDAIKKAPSPFEKESQEVSAGRPHPYHAIKALFKSIPPGSIVVIDGGECGQWAANLAHLSQPHLLIIASGYLGFLGNGFGYTLGCALAAPDRLIINIQGDGSAGFHFMELDTYKRFNLNILTVVVNNYCWGMSSNGQELLYGSKTPARPASSLSPTTAYEVVARGLGSEAEKVDKVDDVAGVTKRILKEDGPGCINLIVSNKPTHPITTAMVSVTDDPNVIVVPYYDNVPRPYYKT